MEYAIYKKLGNELIHVDNSDFLDYKNNLICPECRELVFLRKGFTKTNDVSVRAAFCHFKTSKVDVSVCELRVRAYTQAHIQTLADKAKKRREQKLYISLWKYLKTNLLFDLSKYAEWERSAKTNKVHNFLANYAFDLYLQIRRDFIIEGVDLFIDSILNMDGLKYTNPKYENQMNDFVSSLDRDWNLHKKITKEALTLVLYDPKLKPILKRLACLLTASPVLSTYNALIEKEFLSKEWCFNFIRLLSTHITSIFLSVNWIKILE